MEKRRLINSIKIGLNSFEAYIVEDQNKLDAFAIYANNLPEPLLLFQQDEKHNEIDIHINPNHQQYVNGIEKLDKTIIQKGYKLFQKFVLEAEDTAKNIAFGDVKLVYCTDVKLLKSIEKMYIAS